MLIKVVGVVFIGLMTVIILKKTSAEISLVISVAVTAVTAIFTLSYIYPYIEELKTAIETSNEGISYFKTALKILCISYITKFVSDTCHDFGENALSGSADIAGKCMIFVLCLPMLTDVLNTALSFLNL